GDLMTRIGWLALGPRPSAPVRALIPPRVMDAAWIAGIGLCALTIGWKTWTFSHTHYSMGQVVHVMALGGLTLLRVMITVLVASVIWVPAGLWLGLSPRRARHAQMAAQFMAAFPANLFCPLVVVAIVHWHLNSNIWLAPLMLLGTQWYILFN
ncbi:sulfonate ABC transporter permease, partial [Komagataeibacter pomaceti]|nr:sulfonate ABC transporter permease [Novacetimonas pomaceti]